MIFYKFKIQMSIESINKMVVRDYIEKIVNTGDMTHISDYIAPDYTEVFNGQSYQVGLDGARAHVEGVRNNYTDLRLVIDNQIAEGDWVATCYTMTGLHAGEWMGMLPTFRMMQVTGVNTDRILDGKIIEHGGAANMLEAFLEIGAIKIVGKDTPSD